MPIIFVENVNFFEGKCSRFTFYDGIKMFFASKVLFTMTEEKPLELLTLVTAFVHQKYKKYIFYGVIICNKHYSIIKKKRVLAIDIKLSKMVKYFGGKFPPLLFIFVMTFIHHN